METKSPSDWDSVEFDYRSGLHTNAAICQKHKITSAELSEAVRTREWVQQILSPENEATVLALAEQDTPRFPIDSLFSNDDIKKKVILTAGAIVKLHRDDISKMRGITNEVINRLVDYLQATGEEDLPDPDEKGQIDWKANKAVPKMLLVLGKDSPADLLEKLSRIMTRMVELERQAYGLDSLTIIPNEEEENQVTKDIRGLADKIRQITADKAQKVEPKEEKKDDVDKR